MIDLIHGDCLEKMKDIPDGSVDLILTDPPYGMDFVSNYRKEKYSKIENDISLDWIDEFCKESERTLKDDRHFYCFCSFHNIDIFKQAIEKHFKIKNMLVWEKNNTSMGDLRGDYAPKYEMIIYAHKGRRLLNGRRDPNILKFSRTGNKIHPTQKPIDLLQFLIEKSTSAGECVFDPFASSGSTGVAAKNLGRSFIGIEKDSNYFEIAQDRILK